VTYVLITFLALGCAYVLLVFFGRYLPSDPDAPPYGELLHEANGWATYKVKAYRPLPPRLYGPSPGGSGPGKRRADLRRRYAKWERRYPEFTTKRVYTGPTLRRHWVARVVGVTLLVADAVYLGSQLLL